MKNKMTKIAVAFIAFALTGCGSKSSIPDGWLPAASNLWTGVIVCSRDKEPLFQVVGGNDNVQFPDGTVARGIKVIMPGGREEWKNRDSIVKAYDYYTVLKNDPALAAQRWKVIRP